MFLKLRKPLGKDCFNTLLEGIITLFMPLKCKNINWIQVIKILLIEDSETSNKCAIVVSENPVLSLSRVIYISYFGVNRRVGPVFYVFRWLRSFAFSLPFESQYFKCYLAGPRNVNNVSNCSGKSPVKNFVFCLFFQNNTKI